MLSHIQIRDFAIIDHIELELDSGLTVLSGETGAGKSILVDALTLVLGARADAGMIRHGSKRADITATFDLASKHPALDWLGEQSLDAQDECIIRRTIQEGGRSRAFINGQTVPVQTLRNLGELLADIHGQHEHQTLTKRKTQKAILDSQHEKLLANLENLFDQWQSLSEEFQTLKAAQTDRDDRLDLLGYQVRELEALNLTENELQGLSEEHRKLANMGRLMSGVQIAMAQACSTEDTSAQDQLSKASRCLDELTEVDPKIKPALALLQSAEIQVSEAGAELSSYITTLDVDPGRLDFVEKRLASIEDLGRKHRIPADQLPAHLEALKTELRLLENAEVHLSELEEKTKQAESAYMSKAKKLTSSRKKAGAKLSETVSNMMQTLGMPGGMFRVDISSLDENNCRKDGLDLIEYQVSANPGQPAKPLSKVASGGELARISLAIQVAAANATPNTTMVFDEVDSGVGGGVAEIVGRQLRNLGQEIQVLCVTHLPQVASQAHHHVRVSKLTDGKKTHTTLSHLTDDETVEEIARMLGGVDITSRTREHAQEMLSAAKSG